MTTVIPEGFGTATWVMTVPGDPDPYTCGFGFHLADTAELDGYTETLYNAWKDNLLVGQASFLTLARCETLYNENDADPHLERSFSGGASGSGSGGYLPQNNSMLVRKNTGLAGRKQKGRFYMPYALAEGSTDDYGNISSAALSDQQARADAFLDDATSLVLPVAGLVILHGDATPPTDLINLEVDSRISTQRRRLR